MEINPIDAAMWDVYIPTEAEEQAFIKAIQEDREAYTWSYSEEEELAEYEALLDD